MNASDHLKEERTTSGPVKQRRKQLLGQELPGSRDQGGSPEAGPV